MHIGNTVLYTALPGRNVMKKKKKKKKYYTLKHRAVFVLCVLICFQLQSVMC